MGQKRFNIPDSVYFITMNTYCRNPYFENKSLCKLFIDELKFAETIKDFKVLGYKINYEHIHLLLRLGNRYTCSQILHSLKTNFSRNANRILGFSALPSNPPQPRSRDLGYISFLKNLHNGLKNHSLPKFKWQSSFHDRIMRDEEDLFHHMDYLEIQWIKHNLPKNEFLYLDKKELGLYA